MGMKRYRMTFPVGMRLQPDGTGRGVFIDFDETHVEFVGAALAEASATFDAAYGLVQATDGGEEIYADAPLAAPPPQPPSPPPVVAAQIQRAPGPDAGSATRPQVMQPRGRVANIVSPPVPARAPVVQVGQFRPDMIAPPNAVMAQMANGGPTNQPAIRPPPPPHSQQSSNVGAADLPNASASGVAIMPQPPVARPPPAPMVFPDGTPVEAQSAPAGSRPGQHRANLGRIGPATPEQIAAARAARAAQTPSQAAPAPAQASPRPDPVQRIRHAAAGFVNEDGQGGDPNVQVVGPAKSGPNGIKLVLGPDGKAVGAKLEGPIQPLPQPPVAPPPPPPPGPRLVNAAGGPLRELESPEHDS